MAEPQLESTFEERIRCLILFFNFTHVTEEHLKVFFASPVVTKQKLVTRKRKIPSVTECNFSKSDMQIFFKHFSFLSFTIDAVMFRNYERIKRHGFRDVKWMLFEAHVTLTGDKAVISEIHQALNVDMLSSEQQEKDFKIWCQMEEPVLQCVFDNDLYFLFELFIISGNKIKAMRGCSEAFVFEKVTNLISYFVFRKMLSEKKFFELFYATMYVLNKKTKISDDCPLLCLMISHWQLFWKL